MRSNEIHWSPNKPVQSVIYTRDGLKIKRKKGRIRHTLAKFLICSKQQYPTKQKCADRGRKVWLTWIVHKFRYAVNSCSFVRLVEDFHLAQIVFKYFVSSPVGVGVLRLTGDKKNNKLDISQSEQLQQCLIISSNSISMRKKFWCVSNLLTALYFRNTPNLI